MDNKLIIASSLTDTKLAKAFTQLVAERWDNWDFTPYMAYLVDVCHSSVLPYLAEQFDVEGLRGFEIASNEAQQRELIKKSIALHKFMGTPWAIREACRTVGFPVIILEEGITALDGIPRAEDWARFRVYVVGNDSRTVTEEEARKLRLFIEYYKNARSHLGDFGFYHTYQDGPVFLSTEEQRERLTVYYFSVSPNPVLINPDGAAKVVTVDTNTPWEFEALLLDWNDGTGEKITLEITADNEVTVKSEPATGSDRETAVKIYSAGGGLLLGTLTIQQHSRWRNAYSRAYSNAYNLYPKNYSNSYSRAYNRAYNKDISFSLSTNEINLTDSGESINVAVYSNTTWQID